MSGNTTKSENRQFRRIEESTICFNGYLVEWSEFKIIVGQEILESASVILWDRSSDIFYEITLEDVYAINGLIDKFVGHEIICTINPNVFSKQGNIWERKRDNGSYVRIVFNCNKQEFVFTFYYLASDQEYESAVFMEV